MNKRRVSRKFAPYKKRKFVPKLTKAVPKPELKYVDTTTSNDTLKDNTPLILLVNGVAQGNGSNQRIGSKIKMHSIDYKLVITTNMDSDGTVPSFQKYMAFATSFVYDKQPNNAACNITDIFVTGTPIAPLNLANRSRFSLLYNKLDVPENWTGFTQVVAAGRHVDNANNVNSGYKSVSLTSVYTDAGGTITSIATGALYLVLRFYNNDSAFLKVLYSARVYIRIRYYDN